MLLLKTPSNAAASSFVSPSGGLDPCKLIALGFPDRKDSQSKETCMYSKAV